MCGYILKPKPLVVGMWSTSYVPSVKNPSWGKNITREMDMHIVKCITTNCLGMYATTATKLLMEMVSQIMLCFYTKLYYFKKKLM